MLTAPVLTIVDGLCNEIGLMSTIKERPPPRNRGYPPLRADKGIAVAPTAARPLAISSHRNPLRGHKKIVCLATDANNKKAPPSRTASVWLIQSRPSRTKPQKVQPTQ